jgi:hypothetical protein
MAPIRYAGEALDAIGGQAKDQIILPDQGTQRERGGADLEWQYPFFRSDLIAAGLLPANSKPASKEKSISLPSGVSVLEAVQAGLI